MFFAILAEFRQKLLVSYSELPHQMQTNVTTASVIDYGLGQLIYKHFNIFFILNIKRTTCGCTNQFRTDSIYGDARAEFSDKKYCASSCNSGDDTYCGTKYYAAIYKITNSTTGIVC